MASHRNRMNERQATNDSVTQPDQTSASGVPTGQELTDTHRKRPSSLRNPMTGVPFESAVRERMRS